MGNVVKVLIGLAAALATGWVWHGPLGQGPALVADLEARARLAIAQAELPGIDVRLARGPLSRAAVLSGPANDLQREGLGSQKGVSDYVREVEGIAGVRWADEPSARRGLPLLAETLILNALAFLVGFGLGRLFLGRRRRQSFLD
jgi:hypothetical protein